MQVTISGFFHVAIFALASVANILVAVAFFKKEDYFTGVKIQAR